MPITKEEIEANLKTNEKLTDIEYLQSGTDEEKYPIYEINYINAPKDFKLVRLIEPLKVAVLEDLTI